MCKKQQERAEVMLRSIERRIAIKPESHIGVLRDGVDK